MPDVRVNIVGVGNTLMGDDGVGPAAVAALADRDDLPAGACLHDAGLALSDVLGRLEPDRPLVVIDAVRAGDEPGTVYRVDVDDLSPVAEGPGGPISLHEISVMPALQIEALTGRRFDRVTVFGVEPADVSWGRRLSAPVAAALDGLLDAVIQHVHSVQPAELIAGEPAR